MTTSETIINTEALVARHRPRLDAAAVALRTREYFSAYPESPSPRVHGEGAAEAGSTAFEALLGHRFELGTPGADGWVGGEVSPYGMPLGITYPHVPVEALLAAAKAALVSWSAASPDVRAATCVEMINRIHARSFEMAHAVMHTTGQAFVMAFQAGGAHAQDRALESVAAAWAEQTRVAATVVWEKPQGKRPPQRMEKQFIAVPRGVAVVIGCTTFPTWNSYPGLFASLATGNAVIVKPHPAAILPLAITVSVIRDVLRECGYDPDLVTLAVEDPGERLAAVLAVRPEISIIDFTGSASFGNWLEENARQARVYSEKSGVNSIILESTDDYAGMLGNIAMSLSLYSGQMCTTPQNLLIPAAGIGTEQGTKSVNDVAADLGAALGRLLGDDARATGLLGAIVNEDVLDRLQTAVAKAESTGRVAVRSRAVTHAEFPAARIRTPLVIHAGSDDLADYGQECFGPVAYLVTVADATGCVELFTRLGHEKGALTAAVFSLDPALLDSVRSAALDVGVALSENLTHDVLVNQSAAFSDFHGTGANPAANASFVDADFVAGRFRTVQLRRHLPKQSDVGSQG